MNNPELTKLKGWMRRRFQPEWCGEWDSTIHVVFSDAGTITVDAKDRALRVSSGLKGEPLATIHTSVEVLAAVLRNDVPLDMAVMRDELTTDNLVEVFKFVSVFKPPARRKTAGGPGRAAKRAPLLTGKERAKSVLDEWGDRVFKDEYIREKLRGAGVGFRAVARVLNPDFDVNVRINDSGLKIGCAPDRKKADFEVEAAVLHKILSGVQNLAIGLTQKNLDVLVEKGIEEKVIEMLIYLQPRLSKIYRDIHAERRLWL